MCCFNLLKVYGNVLVAKGSIVVSKLKYISLKYLRILNISHFQWKTLCFCKVGNSMAIFQKNRSTLVRTILPHQPFMQIVVSGFLMSLMFLMWTYITSSRLAQGADKIKLKGRSSLWASLPISMVEELLPEPIQGTKIMALNTKFRIDAVSSHELVQASWEVNSIIFWFTEYLIYASFWEVMEFWEILLQKSTL